MVQYIIDNILSFSIGIAFVISTLILGLYFLVHALRQNGLSKYRSASFGWALLAFAGAHIIWTIRAATFINTSPAYIWFPFWQGFWIFFITGIIFLGLWSLLLAYPDWLATKKWYLLVLLIPWLIVVIDVLVISNSETAQIVCSALIWDARPDLIVMLAAALALTFFIGLALDYYYQQFKQSSRSFLLYLIIMGLLLLLVGGVLDCKPIPICQVITVGRTLMLSGIWLTSFGLIRLGTQPTIK